MIHDRARDALEDVMYALMLAALVALCGAVYAS